MHHSQRAARSFVRGLEIRLKHIYVWHSPVFISVIVKNNIDLIPTFCNLLNIDDRNQLETSDIAGTKRQLCAPVLGWWKNNAYILYVCFLRKTNGWKWFSCWSTCERLPLRAIDTSILRGNTSYLQHLTVWMPLFPDGNRIHLNLLCRTLFYSLWFSSVYYSKILEYNIEAQQQIYEVAGYWSYDYTNSAHIQELCTFNWEFPKEHVLTHAPSVTTGSVCYDFKWNRTMSFNLPRVWWVNSLFGRRSKYLLYVWKTNIPGPTPVYNIWSTTHDIMWGTHFIVTE
jgi:hypothetical protein